MRLFHITPRAAWRAAQRAGVYRAPSLDEVGFIHLSTEDQWRGTLKRWFAGATDLVLLEIDGDRVAAPVRFEGGFPHLYGELELAAVIAVHDLEIVA